MSRFDGATVVVTGAAEGIGRGIADMFAAEGAKVAIFDWNEELGSAAAEEIAAQSGASTLFCACDVSQEESVRSAVAKAVAALGDPTVLVNNAGVFVLKGLDATPEDWRRVLDVNVMGTALVAKHVVPHMRNQGGGAIVNIGSVASFIAQPEFVTYCASKAAIPAITRCLALDLDADSIRVNCVCPGAVWSATVQRMSDEAGLSREELSGKQNLGLEQIQRRIAGVEEVASAVLFLASAEASFITGTSLMVDGGWTAI